MHRLKVISIFANLIAALATLAACSTTEQAGQAMRSSWTGKSADDFFAAHGAPTQSHTAADGRRMYTWGTRSNAPMGGPSLYCSADIVADPSGRISDVRPRADSIGLWNTSRCAEIFSGG